MRTRVFALHCVAVARSRVNLWPMKVVGNRIVRRLSAEEALRRAVVLQAQVDRLNPFPRPRGFVFRAKTWEAYETWRRCQANPRLW